MQRAADPAERMTWRKFVKTIPKRRDFEWLKDLLDELVAEGCLEEQPGFAEWTDAPDAPLVWDRWTTTAKGRGLRDDFVVGTRDVEQIPRSIGAPQRAQTLIPKGVKHAVDPVSGVSACGELALTPWPDLEWGSIMRTDLCTDCLARVPLDS